MSLYGYQVKKVPFLVEEDKTLTLEHSGTDILISKQRNYTIKLPPVPQKGVFFRFTQYDQQQNNVVTIDAGSSIIDAVIIHIGGQHNEKSEYQLFSFTEESNAGDYVTFYSDGKKWIAHAFGLPNLAKSAFELSNISS